MAHFRRAWYVDDTVVCAWGMLGWSSGACVRELGPLPLTRCGKWYDVILHKMIMGKLSSIGSGKHQSGVAEQKNKLRRCPGTTRGCLFRRDMHFMQPRGVRISSPASTFHRISLTWAAADSAILGICSTGHEPLPQVAVKKPPNWVTVAKSERLQKLRTKRARQNTMR